MGRQKTVNSQYSWSLAFRDANPPLLLSSRSFWQRNPLLELSAGRTNAESLMGARRKEERPPGDCRAGDFNPNQPGELLSSLRFAVFYLARRLPLTFACTLLAGRASIATVRRFSAVRLRG